MAALDGCVKLLASAIILKHLVDGLCFSLIVFNIPSQFQVSLDPESGGVALAS